MAKELRIRIFDEEAIRLARSRLKNPSKLMKQIGVTLLRESQLAFERQAFGDIDWPPRYPNDPAPYVNYAGVVSDLSRGASIKDRRFQNRPALLDTGRLKNSLSPSTGMRLQGAYIVEVGSNLPYATTQHAGGETKQPVTQAMKKRLADYMKKQRGAIKSARKRSTPLTKRQAGTSKLGFLFGINELVTNVAPRPFVGITDDAGSDIDELVTDFFTKGK